MYPCSHVHCPLVNDSFRRIDTAVYDEALDDFGNADDFM